MHFIFSPILDYPLLNFSLFVICVCMCVCVIFVVKKALVDGWKWSSACQQGIIDICKGQQAFKSHPTLFVSSILSLSLPPLSLSSCLIYLHLYPEAVLILHCFERCFAICFVALMDEAGNIFNIFDVSKKSRKDQKSIVVQKTIKSPTVSDTFVLVDMLIHSDAGTATGTILWLLIVTIVINPPLKMFLTKCNI